VPLVVVFLAQSGGQWGLMRSAVQARGFAEWRRTASAGDVLVPIPIIRIEPIRTARFFICRADAANASSLVTLQTMRGSRMDRAERIYACCDRLFELAIRQSRRDGVPSTETAHSPLEWKYDPVG
jgi:hypothetical protein